ncbi:ABC transporter ATP-binding protein [Gulosibacter faecalis]|jgi:putative ABC transport system ATP-binding protein|uniref:ABC transporter ATP-binding protein n=1 Tax=Gulosibacter faecalis TaxID=272240 RepID=A0ABW5UX96_9MICO|nr:ABC transporter ATP-binding protein [Gulosibacter faecalis]
MLTLDHLTLTYQDGDDTLTAVDDANLTVAPGEFVAVTGPSGSGKSSLLALASTLVTADAGSVRIDDTTASDLSSGRAAELRRNRLGIVFQAPNLIGSLKVREQLEVMARMGAQPLAGLSKADLRARIDQALDEVGMLDRAEFLPSQLSGGQRQRVNIARAIVNDPDAMLVDEPTSALDEARSADIMRLLRDLTHERRLATVVVTHDLAQLPLFDTAYEMHDGKLGEGIMG